MRASSGASASAIPIPIPIPIETSDWPAGESLKRESSQLPLGSFSGSCRGQDEVVIGAVADRVSYFSRLQVRPNSEGRDDFPPPRSAMHFAPKPSERELGVASIPVPSVRSHHR